MKRKNIFYLSVSILITLSVILLYTANSIEAIYIYKIQEDRQQNLLLTELEFKNKLKLMILYNLKIKYPVKYNPDYKVILKYQNNERVFLVRENTITTEDGSIYKSIVNFNSWIEISKEN